MILFAGISLVIGLAIPGFYDWTGSDQSRPSPLISYAMVGLLVLATAVSLPLPWINLADLPPNSNILRKRQFRIRSILALTALLAVFLAALPRTSSAAAGSCTSLIILATAGRSWIQHPHARPNIACAAGNHVFSVRVDRVDGSYRSHSCNATFGRFNATCHRANNAG